MNNQQFSTSQYMQPLPTANNSAQSYGNTYEDPYTSPYTQASSNSYAQSTQNLYINSKVYYEQNKVKNETPMTKRMKSQFSFFGLASAIYAVFYAFCLYKNASGITYPFFVAGTLCYFFFSMKKLGVPFKKGSIFYVISIMLLGISNCCTASPQLLVLNKLGIFLLSFVLMLHTIYQDNSWGLPKYLSAIFHTLCDSCACVFSPFIDMASFFAAKKQEKSDKNSKMIYIIIGLALSVPVLTLMTALLCSADIVFQNMIGRLLSFDFAIAEIFKIALLIAVVFTASYALLTELCKKRVKEVVSDKKFFEPIIAIIITGMLSMVYLMFSMIQILYLFIGNMQLPDGYTYSAYARQGFFQLLAVCVLNLIIVLLCLSFFKDNVILKIILTVISGCTFIMILSSALRMFMYIEMYNLTFLRIFVLWALAVIFLLMTGVTVYIYFQRFPLFLYSVAVTTVFYIAFSYAHPDYWIASYNLNPSHIYQQDGDMRYSYRYLAGLSADAAPVILNEEKNPYMQISLKTMEKYAALEKQYGYGSKNFSYDKYYDLQEQIDDVIQDENDRNIYYYYKNIYNASEDMHIRSFNFSIFFAGKSAGIF